VRSAHQRTVRAEIHGAHSAPYRFFGGKGGVGKTTCAAAAAVGSAESGKRVLVVSTDPAHSLGDALKASLGPAPIPIATRRGTLLAAELDAGLAWSRWSAERRTDLEILAERGTYLDREDVRRLLDLSLPGVDELVGLVELLRLARESARDEVDEVVVDTAPTAHTLRLLAMPEELRRLAAALDRLQERHRAVAATFAGVWRPDASDALVAEIAAQGEEIHDLLRDPARTAFLWVLLPEALSVAETRDGVAALEAAGIPVPELIVNRVTRVMQVTRTTSPCPQCAARQQAEAAAIAELRASFPGRAVRFLPELATEPRGVTALRRVARALGGAFTPGPSPISHPPPAGRGVGSGRKQKKKERGRWLDAVLPAAPRLVFFGGKGGVGKTTCAAAAALLLAERTPGRRVLLLSTDPAHSLADALDVPLGDDARAVPGAPANLSARELDAARAFAAWRERHQGDVEGLRQAAGADLDPQALADLLDLAPPGLDELSAVSALADGLFGDGDDGERAAYDLLVVDTAPTGHTLRLLAAPALMLEWVHTLLSLLLKYREVVALGRFAAELVALSRSLKQLIEVLHDRERCRFLAVTRAAELPRLETGRLLAALDRLAIGAPASPAVIVNAVPVDGCPRRGPVRGLSRLALAGREGCAIIAPAVFPPPRGVRALREWAATWELRSTLESRPSPP